MPETDLEKEHRSLRELEGKNIANYSVILSEWIRSTMDNIRIMVILSAAGLGSLVLVLKSGGAQAWFCLVIAAGAFVGFFASMVLNLRIMERNAGYLSHSINVGSDKDLDLENPSLAGKKFFFFGCWCLIVLSFLSTYRGRCQGEPWFDTQRSQQHEQWNEPQNTAQMPNGQPVKALKGTAENSGNWRSDSEGASSDTSRFASTDKSKVVADPVRNVIKTSPPTGRCQIPNKTTGNGGNFKSGQSQ